MNTRLCHFKITLLGVEPPIWRSILVPDDYSMWDLHVAIQDAMGWLDYHLHVFRTKGPRHERTIGIPDPMDEVRVEADWEVPIGDVFRSPGDTISYEYDFGDGWRHEIAFEGKAAREAGIAYPVCLNGARACPPEDCGGVSGYERLLEVLKTPRTREYDDICRWLRDQHAKNYWPFKPEKFRSEAVQFMCPAERFRMAFETDYR